MSQDCLKMVFQTLIHDQNNELSKIIMHLENALEDQNFEEVKLALGVFDSYSELTQKYSSFVKKSFSKDPIPVMTGEDVALLEFVLSEFFKRQKRALQLVVALSSEASLSFEQVVSTSWSVLSSNTAQSIRIEFPLDRKTVLVNSVAFDLETFRKDRV